MGDLQNPVPMGNQQLALPPVPPPPPPPPPAAMNQIQPAPDLADAIVYEDDPTYIYTPEGIYKVPLWHFYRDRNSPVWVTAGRWRALSHTHKTFSAAALLNNTPIRAENIVVLSQVNPRDPHGPPLQCNWFVRIAIVANSHLFEEPFGCNYLWQLPYEVCVGIMEEIERYALIHMLAPYEMSPLVRQLKPTSHVFDPDQWAGTERVDKVPSYYDCLFAMAVKPCRGPIPRPAEDKSIVSMARDPILRTCKSSPLQFEGEHSLPDELVRSILEQAVDNWLPCKDWSTFRSLLLLRRVNKTFRDYVDRGAYAFFCKMEDAVRAALKTKTPEDLVEARNILLRDNMCVFSVLAEVGRLHELAIGPSIYCLMRLRSGKKPEEMPPPPPEVVSAEEEAAREAAFLRHAPAAFLRRREKRRRIMEGM